MTEQQQAAQPYDFHRPSHLPGSAQQFFTRWQHQLCELAGEKWGGHLAFDVEWQSPSVETLHYPQALSRLPDEVVAYRIQVGQAAPRMLLALPRQLALALTEGMLGGTGDPLPDDRELTSVEYAIVELIIQELLEVFVESQTAAEPLACQLDGMETALRHTRMFPADSDLAVCHFQLDGPFGQQPMFLLVPEELVAVFVENDCHQDDSQQEISHVTNNLIREIPLEIVVRLGAATLDVVDLSKLSPGDVLVLDQRVTDPVVADVGGELQLTGWAGRVGHKQAIQVIELS